ncbi:MAG: energy transducer TonB family protein [Panacagrimonas sp.]
MALYVAFVLHLLALLILLLLPAPQMPPGPGRGMGIGLELAGETSVLGSAPFQAATVRESEGAGTSDVRSPSRPVTKSAGVLQSATKAVASVADARRETSAQNVPASSSVTLAKGPEPAHPAGISGAAPAAGGGGFDHYFAQLRTHLHAFRRELPRATGSGQAEVQFTVSAQGRVLALSLLRSSGSPDLDTEALDLIRRAQPLPRPPEGHSLELAVPIEIE